MGARKTTPARSLHSPCRATLPVRRRHRWNRTYAKCTVQTTLLHLDGTGNVRPSSAPMPPFPPPLPVLLPLPAPDKASACLLGTPPCTHSELMPSNPYLRRLQTYTLRAPSSTAPRGQHYHQHQYRNVTRCGHGALAGSLSRRPPLRPTMHHGPGLRPSCLADLRGRFRECSTLEFAPAGA